MNAWVTTCVWRNWSQDGNPRVTGKEIKAQIAQLGANQHAETMALGAWVSGASLVTGVLLGYALGQHHRLR